MRALDLFCGAGGASVGLERAGFDVVGIDIRPQPNHRGGEFIQADALEFSLDGFDFVWASPPCQRYVGWQNITAARGGENVHPDLIAPIRERLQSCGVPWAIENVEGAPLRAVVMLCGTMFGLGVRRHRIFETTLPVMAPLRPCRHTGHEVGVYGKLDGRRLFTRKDGSELRNPSGLAQAHAAMGIDWMTWDELRESVPPAYAEHIGRTL